MRTVIAFDITDDRKRYRVVKALKAYATRVQKSVFEATDLGPGAYLRMRGEIEKHVDPRTDSVRYYRLCGSCVGSVEHYGSGPGVWGNDDDCQIV